MTTSLPQELHLEILKRLLPSPHVLARASAVCREWRRVLNDPAFLHEMYGARGGEPVTLGFFHNLYYLPRRFVHVNAGDPVRIPLEFINQMIYLQFMDCRHGRVLIHDGWGRLVVLHPMTGDHHFVPNNKGSFGIGARNTSAAMICECARKPGHCTPCHASHFRVAVISKHDQSDCLEATVFSSLTGQWSSLAELPATYQIRPEPSVSVGKTVYQLLSDFHVLAFDTDNRTLTTFKRPKWGSIRLLKVDGDTLGIAGVRGFTLRLWVRISDDWVMRKTVDLSEILPGPSMPSPQTDPRFTFMPPVKIIGVADGGDELFMWTKIGIFMLYVKSMDLKKVHETTQNMETVYPYAAFYLRPTARTQRLQLSN